MPPQQLFADDNPKPFQEFPPTDAYILAMIGGAIFPLGLVTAPLFAWKYPYSSWKWGLWTALPICLLFLLLMLYREGWLIGVLVVFANPVTWGYVLLCSLFAFVAARTRVNRGC